MSTTTKNYTPTYMLIAAIPLAIIGGIVWKVQWGKADIQLLFGAVDSHWTGGTIAGVVILGVGVLLAFAGMVGLATRR